MPRKTYSYRELIAILKEYDPRFRVCSRRGKGSERMISHPDIHGRAESYPIKCHSEGDDIRGGHILAIKRRFDLPDDLL